ncbi:predicted protein [Uncinocarpus reesii 1704]|uniref:Protein kinase domain-containing protein n=1 Tax=Uncinocarpus reesii (strain UAMH 1704) TaxID=336963 RepID=C4JXC6_UNCRE|nr:uncharacterized protein UREG_06299 [Uncinocarpus reesii 1704]EEP81434.1 predicted protein [Uncinocarpus reesii 1704]
MPDPAYIADPAPPPIYTRARPFTVRSHIPPPIGSPLEPCTPWDDPRKERETISPLQRCLLHPPSGGLDGDHTVEFKVVHHLRAGRDHNSQVVVVSILNVSDNCPEVLVGVTTAVAKFYDPLHADPDDWGFDPFFYSHQCYISEAAAYSKLSDLQGTVIPTYYGSYTLQLPVHEPTSPTTTRTVRLILIEDIVGTSMRDLWPREYSQAERKQIIRAIIDGESEIYRHNIRLRDMHPRNVVVVTDHRAEQRVRRVVLIDFERSWFSRAHFPKDEHKYLPGTYISPLLRWHHFVRSSVFDDWIDWDRQLWLESEYADTASSITRHMESIWGKRLEETED